MRLLKHLRLLERAISATQNGVVITDATVPDEPIVYVNSAFERITGYAAEEVIGRNPRFLRAGEGDQRALEDPWRLRRAKDDNYDDDDLLEWSGVLRGYRRDGAPFCAALSVAAVHDEEGHVANRIGVISDVVTGRERAEEEIRFQARLLDAVGQAVVAVDLRGRISYWNRAAEELYGWSAEEAVGRPAPEVMVCEEQMERAGEIWAELSAGRSWTGEFVVRRRDGSSFPALVTDTPVFDERGDTVGVIGVSADVTGRKEAEEALKESEARFRSVVESIGEGLLITDVDDVVLYANPRAEELTGYVAYELLGRPAYELLLPKEQCPGMLERNRRRLEGVAERYEMRLKRKDGTRFWAEVNATPYRDATGEIVGTLGALTDVTERKEAEEALEESEKLFRQLFEQSSDALLVHDEAGMMVDFNSEACRSLGYSREELLALSVEDFGIKLVSDEEGVDKDRMLWQRVMDAEPGTVTGVVLRMHRRKDGTTFPVEVGLSGIDYGGRRLILASCRDLTEREALEERLTHQAFHDFLTGLPNRALFSDRLKQALARRGRAGSRVAVLFMDLDNFKYVNDSLGHDAGDRLLAAAAGRLKGCVRPEDTVARLGGDEFAVVLEGARDLGDAIRVAQRAVQAFGEPFDLGGREVFAGTSVGIALGEAGRDRPEDLLRKADLALYEAKRGGKARYAVFDPEAERRSLRRLELENGLRRAIERDEFRVRYQPVVSLKSGRVAGFEALLRWEHPERGLIPAGEFVPLAEENGLIVPIGLRVLREACRQAKGWQGLRPDETPPTVGVNLSAPQLRHPDLVGDVEEALNEAGLDPGRLTLEVTEGVLVEDAERHGDALRGLKSLGVRLAIDDFGTGYSSLSYLKRLPAGLLKLDGSFVGNIGEGPGEDEVLLEGVLGIAHGLGLWVVAEGVETAGQAARLRELGCDLAQGNHFSGPLTGREATEVLASGLPRSF